MRRPGELHSQDLGCMRSFIDYYTQQATQELTMTMAELAEVNSIYDNDMSSLVKARLAAFLQITSTKPMQQQETSTKPIQQQETSTKPMQQQETSTKAV